MSNFDPYPFEHWSKSCTSRKWNQTTNFVTPWSTPNISRFELTNIPTSQHLKKGDCPHLPLGCTSKQWHFPAVFHFFSASSSGAHLRWLYHIVNLVVTDWWHLTLWLGVHTVGELLHQLIDGKHPIIYRFSTIQGDAGFCNHPQYVFIWGVPFRHRGTGVPQTLSSLLDGHFRL